MSFSRLGFALLLLLPGFLAHSAPLPSSAEVSLTATNISQENADATEIGANSGDVIRYDLEIKSQTAKIENYSASIQLDPLFAQNFEIVDLGMGRQQSSEIVFDPVTASAPSSQMMTFFARVKAQCADKTSILVESESAATSVKLSCQLSATGPSLGVWLLLILAAGLGFGFFFVRQIKTTS